MNYLRGLFGRSTVEPNPQPAIVPANKTVGALATIGGGLAGAKAGLIVLPIYLKGRIVQVVVQQYGAYVTTAGAKYLGETVVTWWMLPSLVSKFSWIACAGGGLVGVAVVNGVLLVIKVAHRHFSSAPEEETAVERVYVDNDGHEWIMI